MREKKFLDCVTRVGQDIPEESLRDVFNDVSKYIRNISISPNAVLPRTTDNPDVPLSLYYILSSGGFARAPC